MQTKFKKEIVFEKVCRTWEMERKNVFIRFPV